MRRAGHLRGLLAGLRADGLGGTAVWIHWGGIETKASFVCMISIFSKYLPTLLLLDY